MPAALPQQTSLRHHGCARLPSPLELTRATRRLTKFPDAPVIKDRILIPDDPDQIFFLAAPVSTPPSMHSDAVVVLQIAGREGPAFPLDPSGRNILGRAEDSLVALADRLASRSHAAVRFDATAAAWQLEDLGSRNGTWLDGVRVTTALLAEGSLIRVGTTELIFRFAQDPLPRNSPEIVRCGSPAELEGPAVRRALAAGEGRWSTLLYQAGIRLLSTANPSDIVVVTLELAAEFTAATSFGWFTLTADGGIEPICVAPPGSGLPALVAGTAEREAAAGRAVWLTTATGIGLACIPLATGPAPAAMLAAAAPGGLRETDFDLLLTLATFAAAARAGREPCGVAATTTHSADPLDLASSGGSEEALVGPPDDGTISLSPDIVQRWQAGAWDGRPLVPSDAATLRIDDWQQSLALEALRRSGGNVPAAAGLLGVSRATLYRRLEAWGLTRDGGPPAPE